jgi:hypothetical protein
LKGTEAIRWWDAEPGEAHARLTNLVDSLKSRPSYVSRQRQFLLYASLYGNLPILGFGIGTYNRFKHDNRIALNVTANAIDALVAKATKNKAKATMTTMDGDCDAQEKAKLMELFSRGQFHQTKFYKMFPGVVLDACIFGTGFIKTLVTEDGKFRNERTFPFEVITDDRGAMYGEPLHLIQRKYYDKDVIADRFLRPLSKEDAQYNSIKLAVESAAGDYDEDDFDYDGTCDQMLVYESWRLPISKRVKGKHILSIRGAELSFDDWKYSWTPLSKLCPMHEQSGFWGTGFCEKLIGIQAEINRLLRDIQRAMHLIAKPHWMMESSSKVLAQNLNNDMATIIRYSGATPPQVYVPQAMSSEVYEHLQFLYRTAYEITGISQLSAQSQKPAGLNAAVALREFRDVESERFTDFLRNCEETTLEVAEKQIALARELPSSQLKAKTDFGGYKTVTFKDVDLGENVMIQVQPTSILPSTTTGQLQFMNDLNQATGGAIPAEEMLEQLNWPDVESFVKKKNAWKRVLDRNIMIMRSGKQIFPEPYDKLEIVYPYVADAYQVAKLDGVPEAGLECMRRYLDKCIEKMTPPVPAPPPGGALPPPEGAVA